ncbi:MAG: class I SAM-dependent methyltransferase [Lachnospiraceae bacterium]|nr:class I SAM-dependent methyltransferase [Lachnospiraceae bacterium]
MEKLYDRADIYDLIESEERFGYIKKDWTLFLGERNIKTVLDVSIGSGGMTIPLLDMGMDVTGSDLSEAMLERCKKKVEARGKDILLKCTDFRDLSCFGDKKFDMVVSTGNSLGYVSNEDVLKTLQEMDKHVKDGGFICFDSRNWEKIQKETERFYFYNPFHHGENRVNLMQVWDHNPDGSIAFNLLYSFEKDEKIFQREIFEEHYNPFKLEPVTKHLEKLGYKDITVKQFPCYMPGDEFEKMDWYRLIAKKETI